MANGKRLNKAYEGIDRDRVLRRGRGGEARQGARQGEVRRDHRGLDQSQRRSAQVRAECARHGACCRTAPARRCASRSSPRATAPKEAEAAGADIVGAEDLAEKVKAGTIEFDRCIATPDMMVGRRQARQGARPARPDAQPEARHGDAECRRGGQGGQGRPGRISAPRRPASSMPASARRASPRRRWSRTSRPSSARSAAPSRPASKAPSSSASACLDQMGPGLKLDIASVAAEGSTQQ